MGEWGVGGAGGLGESSLWDAGSCITTASHRLKNIYIFKLLLSLNVLYSTTS